MYISALEPYINTDVKVVVVDWDGNEVARYDGKDSMEEVQNSTISQIWVEDGALVIEVY